MITGIQEHHKLHWMLRTTVQILQVLLDLLDKLGEIGNHIVRSVLSLVTLHEIAEDDSLDAEDFFLSELEVELGLVHQEAEQSLFVLIVNHAIAEDTLVLVHPQSDEARQVRHSFGVTGADALEDFAHVSQVESVVRFIWRWLQRLLHFVVHELGCGDEQWHCLRHFRGKRVQKSVQNF